MTVLNRDVIFRMEAVSDEISFFAISTTANFKTFWHDAFSFFILSYKEKNGVPNSIRLKILAQFIADLLFIFVVLNAISLMAII